MQPRARGADARRLGANKSISSHTGDPAHPGVLPPLHPFLTLCGQEGVTQFPSALAGNGARCCSFCEGRGCLCLAKSWRALPPSPGDTSLCGRFLFSDHQAALITDLWELLRGPAAIYLSTQETDREFNGPQACWSPQAKCTDDTY